jgi:hypothetical protein
MDAYSGISFGERAVLEEQRLFRERAIREILDVEPAYWMVHAGGMLVTLFSSQTFVTARLLGMSPGVPVDARYDLSRMGLWRFMASVYAKKTRLEQTYLWTVGVFSGLVYMLALGGMVTNLRSPMVVALGVVALYLIFVPGAIGDGRYRVPAMPLFAVLCSVGIRALMHSWSGASVHVPSCRITDG